MSSKETEEESAYVDSFFLPGGILDPEEEQDGALEEDPNEVPLLPPQKAVANPWEASLNLSISAPEQPGSSWLDDYVAPNTAPPSKNEMLPEPTNHSPLQQSLSTGIHTSPIREPVPQQLPVTNQPLAQSLGARPIATLPPPGFEAMAKEPDLSSSLFHQQPSSFPDSTINGSSLHDINRTQTSLNLQDEEPTTASDNLVVTDDADGDESTEHGASYEESLGSEQSEGASQSSSISDLTEHSCAVATTEKLATEQPTTVAENDDTLHDPTMPNTSSATKSNVPTSDTPKAHSGDTEMTENVPVVKKTKNGRRKRKAAAKASTAANDDANEKLVDSNETDPSGKELVLDAVNAILAGTSQMLKESLQHSKHTIRGALSFFKVFGHAIGFLSSCVIMIGICGRRYLGFVNTQNPIDSRVYEASVFSFALLLIPVAVDTLMLIVLLPHYVPGIICSALLVQMCLPPFLEPEPFKKYPQPRPFEQVDHFCAKTLSRARWCLPIAFLSESFQKYNTSLFCGDGVYGAQLLFLILLIHYRLILSPVAWFGWSIQMLFVSLWPWKLSSVLISGFVLPILLVVAHRLQRHADQSDSASPVPQGKIRTSLK